MDPSATTLLILALLALVPGPLLYGASRLSGRMMPALDGFLLVAMGGLVLLCFLPDSAALAGWVPAAAAVAAGLWLPALAGRRLPSLRRPAQVGALLLGLAALALHASADGLALSGRAGGDSSMSPLAVVLHRVPVGLAVWFLLRPLYGLAPALAALGGLAAATAGGFLGIGGVEASIAGSRAWGLFQALTAGALLHLVLHRTYPVAAGAGGAARRWQPGLGAVAGLVLVAAITAGREAPGALAGTGGVFYTLAVESAPALLIAYVGAGLVYALLPQGTVDWMGRGSRLSQAARGMAFGLPLPVCSCGVVPLYRSIVVAGVPPTAAMAFLVATPELSLDAVLISLPLLGGEFTVVRVAAAAAVAFGTAWFVGRFASRLVPQGPTAAGADGGGAPLTSRLRTGLAQGLGEVVDSTAPWILVGLALAALVHGLMGTRWSELVPAGFEVEIMALVGMPVYVCAAGATPLVAVLVLNGVSPGAALAFLITGPATNVTTLGVLTQLHGRRIALLFAATVGGGHGPPGPGRQRPHRDLRRRAGPGARRSRGRVAGPVPGGPGGAGPGLPRAPGPARLRGRGPRGRRRRARRRRRGCLPRVGIREGLLPGAVRGRARRLRGSVRVRGRAGGRLPAPPRRPCPIQETAREPPPDGRGRIPSGAAPIPSPSTPGARGAGGPGPLPLHDLRRRPAPLQGGLAPPGP